MEVVDPSEPHHRHKWLERLGLEEGPPDPDTWVAVARAMHPDDAEAKSSREASRLVDRLGHAGIEACQCSYEFDTTKLLGVGSDFAGVTGGIVTRVAVLVHHEDRVRATEIAAEMERESEQQERERVATQDEELTREALAAGPPPDD